MRLPHSEVCALKKSSRNFSGSLDWALRNNLLTIALDGYHTTGFLFVGYVKGWVCATRVPDPLKLRYSIHDMIASATQTSWTEHAKKLCTDLTLFVPPVGHVLKCTKLTMFIQILWVPLSYTANFIHLTSTILFYSDKLKWEISKGHCIFTKSNLLPCTLFIGYILMQSSYFCAW